MHQPKSKRMKYFKKNCFPSKFLSEGVGISFENFTEIFPQKSEKFLVKVLVCTEPEKKFRKNLFVQNVFWIRKNRFDNLSVHFCRKSETILTTTQQKQIGVYQKVIFHQRVRVNSKKAVLTSLQRESSKSRKKFRLKSKFTQKLKNLWKICLFNLFTEHVEKTSDKLSVNVLPIVTNNFARSSEVEREKNFSKKTSFHPTVLLERVESSFDNFMGKFSAKSQKKNGWKSEYVRKTLKNSNKSVSSTGFLSK